jgi:hypothetical protein
MKIIMFLSSLIITVGLLASSAEDTNLSQARLKIMLKTVEPWPCLDTNYPSTNWAQLVAAAKIFQKSSPSTVEQALRQYQMGGATNGEFQRFNDEQLDNDTKLYLLMRVVFDLPETVPANTKQIIVFGYWSGRWLKENGEMNSDGTINLAWPIRWNHGHPELIGGCIGLQGVDTRYDAGAEYQYFRGKYPYRNLSEFKEQLVGDP